MVTLSPILLKDNRKGLSEVIATLLIILISVAAIALLAQIVIPFVKNTLNKSTECLKYKDHYKFEEVFSSMNGEQRYNCYKDNLVGFSIKVDSTAEVDLSGFDLVLIEEGSSKKLSIRRGDVTNANLRMLNSGISNLQVPTKGEIRTYVHEKQTGEGQYIAMEVYPVLDSGRICEASDRIKLVECASGITL